MMAIFVTLHSCSSYAFYSSVCSLGITEVYGILSIFGRIRQSNGKVIIHMNVILHRISKMSNISGGPECKEYAEMLFPTAEGDCFVSQNAADCIGGCCFNRSSSKHLYK